MNSANDRAERWGLWLVALLLGVIVTLAVNFGLAIRVFGAVDSPGILGDLFGLSNALFSGLAFGGLIVAILLQRSELSLQREELVSTREELKEQKEQFVIQSNEMKRRNLESSFYNLLATHHDIRQSIAIREDSGDVSSLKPGADAIADYYGEFLGVAEGLESFGEVFTPEKRKQILIPIYNEWLKGKRHHLIPLNNHLAVIMKFLSGQDPGGETEYCEQLRATLSPWELAISLYDATLREESWLDPHLFVRLGFVDDVGPDLLAREDDIDVLLP